MSTKHSYLRLSTSAESYFILLKMYGDFIDHPWGAKVRMFRFFDKSWLLLSNIRKNRTAWIFTTLENRNPPCNPCQWRMIYHRFVTCLLRNPPARCIMHRIQISFAHSCWCVSRMNPRPGWPWMLFFGRHWLWFTCETCRDVFGQDAHAQTSRVMLLFSNHAKRNENRRKLFCETKQFTGRWLMFSHSPYGTMIYSNGETLPCVGVH